MCDTMLSDGTEKTNDERHRHRVVANKKFSSCVASALFDVRNLHGVYGQSVSISRRNVLVGVYTKSLIRFDQLYSPPREYTE